MISCKQDFYVIRRYSASQVLDRVSYTSENGLILYAIAYKACNEEIENTLELVTVQASPGWLGLPSNA